VWALWLASHIYLPIAPDGGNGKCVLNGNSEGTEALAALAIEAHGWLWEGVPVPAFTRLECLDPSTV
jgi:hypothetical protein